jgi:hypothetical protein
MSKSGYGTCAVVVGALGFFATIALTAETKAEDAAPANPPSGAAAPSAQQAPPGMLTWQIRDVTDKMTNAKTRKAVSGGAFDDGIALEASAMCDKVGVEFAFDTFRNHKPAQFAWQEGEIALRVRVDGGAVRTARAKGEYGNEVKIAFYDPVVAEHLIRGATPRADRGSPILGPFNDVMANAMLNAIQSDAAGKLNELSGARSIRVELPLANGNAYAVELNPQDQALGAIVRQCMADLRAGVESEQRAAEEARKRAEQVRIAKANEERLEVQQRDKAYRCPPNQVRVLLFNDQLRSLDEYDPRKPGAVGTITQLTAGAKVWIVGDAPIDGTVPAGAKIPWNRCVVRYTGPQGALFGTLVSGNLITEATYNAR